MIISEVCGKIFAYFNQVQFNQMNLSLPTRVGEPVNRLTSTFHSKIPVFGNYTNLYCDGQETVF